MDVKTSQIGLLSKLLDVANLRHRVIAQNMANINTPDYHRLDVSFEEAFTKRLGKDSKLDAGSLAPKVMEASGGPVRGDGNNVDLDAEIGRLGKNAFLHNTYVQLLAGNLAMMRSAITGR
jgi:flagellar basal-body rod protein FlgB